MAAAPNLTNIAFNTADNSVTITATTPADPVLDHGYFDSGDGRIITPDQVANATHVYLMLAIPIKDIKDMSDTTEKQLKVNALERLHVSFFGKINNYFQDLNNNNRFSGIVELINAHANKNFNYDITKSVLSYGKKLTRMSSGVTDQNFEHNHEVTQYMDELTKLDYKEMNIADIQSLTATIRKAIGYANGTEDGSSMPILDRTGAPIANPVANMQPDQYTLLTNLIKILALMEVILRPNHDSNVESVFSNEILNFQDYKKMKDRLLLFLYKNQNKKGGSMKKQRRIKSGIPKYRSKKQRKPTRK